MKDEIDFWNWTAMETKEVYNELYDIAKGIYAHVHALLYTYACVCVSVFACVCVCVGLQIEKI